VLTATLVEASEQPTIVIDRDEPSLRTISSDDVETADADDYAVNNSLPDTDLADAETKSALAESNDFDIDSAANRDDDDMAIASPMTVEHGISPDEHDDDVQLDDLIAEPKKSDDLDAAAQRIDEWFRSAKSAPGASQSGADRETPSAAEFTEGLAPTGPLRTNVTIDMNADDEDELAADFDLGEPEDLSSKRTISEDELAWDDNQQMDDLLGDADQTETAEFAAGFANDENAEIDSNAGSDERPQINLVADSDSAEGKGSKQRGRRRQRSFARSLILTVVGGLLGLGVGYYGLLWLRGPSADILQVAQFLPKAVLPASFDRPQPTLRSTPPVDLADVPQDAGEADAEPSEPQPLPSVAEQSAEPISDGVASDVTPANAPDESTEVQAAYTEEEPAADASAAASPVGDRYSTPGETEVPVENDSTATGVTLEKPAIADLSVDDLAPTETPSTDAADATGDAGAAPDLPATPEPAATNVAETEVTNSEPAAFDASVGGAPTDSLDNYVGAVTRAPSIAGSPSLFAAEELQKSLETAAKAQPQLVTGNFADSATVAQAKGRSYMALADLAQKTTFADISQPTSKQMVEQANDLFRQTLADPRIRAEVAQIMPRWVQSPKRDHGGVFFAGKVVGHAVSGSVLECQIELDGGRTVTMLAPAEAAEQLDATKPLAIVGWLVDVPKTQVSGYTGAAKSAAVWTNQLIPLQ
jgi:hypothetical protein